MTDERVFFIDNNIMKSHRGSLVRRGAAHANSRSCNSNGLAATSEPYHYYPPTDLPVAIQSNDRDERYHNRFPIWPMKSEPEAGSPYQLLQQRSHTKFFQFQRERQRLLIRVAWLGLAILMILGLIIFQWEVSTQSSQHSTPRASSWNFRSTELAPILLNFVSSSESKTLSLHRPTKPLQGSSAEDYGGLVIWFLENDGERRTAFRDYMLERGETNILQRNRDNRDDDVEDYYAFDDDRVRSQFGATADDSPLCRRPNWYRLIFPTCNTMHEMAMESPDSRLTYVSYGAYRDVFTLEHHYGNATDTVAVKQIREGLKFQHDNYEYVRMDVLVSERLTASPYIANVYTHCGVSMVTEFFQRGDLERLVVPEEKWKPKPITLESENNFTTTDKLRLALEMAEGIAALHGFPDGLMVHNDIQLTQYLRSDQHPQVLKLNDFNRAEVMLWDDEHQQYCRYRNGIGQGDNRAPEEYMDKPLNEKVDVWSFGNNMYALLTGRYPFYNLNDDNIKRNLVKNGTRQLLDPGYRTKSVADRRLVELIEQCWKYDPDMRADIFTIIKGLQQAIAANEHASTTGGGTLIMESALPR